MKGMLAISPQQETALRKIEVGDRGSLDPDLIRRLLQLDLTEWNGWRWHLTTVGRQGYDFLLANGTRPSAA
ncbi:MAG: hypothetical protein ISP49_11715 [Reyranella sp.]|nr:hypothetical protein [Reyranella sp.]MBL6652253.1 hypothetical protein [Reyranella sp.]